MYFLVVRGFKTEALHPVRQREIWDNHLLCIVPAKNIEEVAAILKGKIVSRFEDKYEIFLPRVLFSGLGHRNPEHVSYDVANIHFEIPNHTDGLTLWAKAIPIMEVANLKVPVS